MYKNVELKGGKEKVRGKKRKLNVEVSRKIKHAT